MAFNANEHMMKLKGKDYLQVAWRMVWFREDHPDYGLDATALELTEDHAIFKAVITDANGTQLSSGHGSESKRDFGDFIEKAETKAVGRALAMLGYGTQFAADELDEGERIVDSPIDRKAKGSTEAAQDVDKAKLEQVTAKVNAAKGRATDEQVAFIRDNADDETWLKAMNAFGDNLERMTNAQANKLIERIKADGGSH